jgi:hypothetical protein
MCPDRQILSVFFDDELPSPWKEKMEAHLAECPQCRIRLEQYRYLSSVTAADGPEAFMEAAGERVWQRIGEGAGCRNGRRREAALWRRSVSVPLPAAAAAAAVLLIASFAALGSRVPEKAAALPDSLIAAGIDLDVQEIVPASDMNGVLQFLGQDDTADIVIIRLPESRNFKSAGEPTILKAADYSRRNTAR